MTIAMEICFFYLLEPNSHQTKTKINIHSEKLLDNFDKPYQSICSYIFKKIQGVEK